MSMHCNVHYIDYEYGRGCPGCRADQEAEDRQNILDALNRISENQIDVSELADKLNNPGDYYCPACKLKSLQFLAKRCPKCQVDVNEIDAGYWDREIAWKKAQDEKRAQAEKERAEKKAQAERQALREKAETETKARESQKLGCFFWILVIAGIIILCILYNIKSPLSTSGESYTPPARSEYPAPTTREVPEQIRIEPPPSVSKEPERFFTLGSTIDEVRLAQGEPSVGFMPGTQSWFYGHDGAAVYFSEGRVWGWTSYPGAPLKARIIPNGPVDETLKYFTVGSTMDEVLFVQGQPFSIGPTSVLTGTLLRTDEEVRSGAPTIKTSWEYGFKSKVFFRDGKVTHWEQDNEILCWKSTGPIVLKARIVPRRSIDPTPAYFTLGSSRDEVLSVQGQPDNPFGSSWMYGRSEVSFGQAKAPSYNRVTGWKSDSKHPLKARIVPSGSVDENLQYFTVGSTVDEVLFVQGQPDSTTPSCYYCIDSNLLTYGPSSVNFEKGRVVNWISYPYHAPLKAKPKK